MEVYGCQMNLNDSELIRRILLDGGFEEVADDKLADCILIVTCAVREKAEVRALGRAAQLSGIRKDGSRPIVALCGCVAQEHGEGLLGRVRGIDLVVGPDCYRQLPALLLEGSSRSCTELTSEDYEGLVPVRKAFPRAFVTIMRGCDNFCSYCIVPHVRGRERSRRMGAVLEEVAALSGQGYRDITLLGQNVNSYSSDGASFPELLREASAAARPAWIRFVTSHPRDFSDELISVIPACRNICRQVHLPAQSGNDRILSLMGRGYTRRDYLGRIGALREAVPGVVLSTDLIAGFPGESEEEFGETLSLLTEAGFDYAFLFRYSERLGTAAADLPDRIPVTERLRRLHLLQEAQKRITEDRSAALEGTVVPVLVTGPGAGRGQMAGRTAGNRAVIFRNGAPTPGRFVTASITGTDGWTHFAEVVEVLGPDGSPEASETRAAP